MTEELINRRAAIREIIQADSYCDASNEKYKKTKDVLDILYDLPSARNTVKTCKYCDKYIKDEKTGANRCSLLNFYPKEDWYCAGAELERRK